MFFLKGYIYLYAGQHSLSCTKIYANPCKSLNIFVRNVCAHITILLVYASYVNTYNVRSICKLTYIEAQILFFFPLFIVSVSWFVHYLLSLLDFSLRSYCRCCCFCYSDIPFFKCIVRQQITRNFRCHASI